MVKRGVVVAVLMVVIAVAAYLMLRGDDTPAPRSAPETGEERPAEVLGRVERAGSWVVGADVFLAPRGGEPRRVSTNKEGAFHFVGLEPGAYEIWVEDAPKGMIQSLSLVSGEVRGELVLEMPRPSSMEGRILLDGVGGEARVWLYYEEEARASWTGVTELDGRYDFVGLRPGLWRLEASAAGFRREVTKPFRLRSGEHRDIGVLRLEWGAEVSGVIRTEEGEPLAQARVNVLEGAGDQRAGARSGADGAYRLTRLKGPMVRVRVSAPGYRSEERAAVAEPGDRVELDVDLVALEGVVLRVLNPEGEQISGARVVLETTDGPLEAVTGEADLLLEGVRGGPYRAWAEHEELGRSDDVMVWAGQTEVLQLGGEEGTGMVLEVEGEDGALEVSSVRVVRAGTEEEVVRRMLRGDGDAVSVRMEPGEYQVYARSPGYEPSETGLWEVRSGQMTTVRIVLQRGGVLRGVVVSAEDGQRVSGARLTLQGVGSRAQSGADGRFEMQGVGEQPRTLVARAEGYRTRYVSGIEGGRDSAVEVRVELTPLAEGEVEATEYVGVGVTLRSEAEGVVEIGEVFPGTPGAEAGLERGDRIVAVDGVSSEALTLRELNEQIRGEEGEPVELRLRRDGEERVVVIERGVVLRTREASP